MTNELHVVLGASGGAGNAIVHALADRGHSVRAVNRGGNAVVPSGVEQVAADIADPAGAVTAVAGASVVYMAAQPAYHRWVEEFPAMLTNVVDAVAGANARLIMVDNLYMYARPTTLITEHSAEESNTRKGRVRTQMTQMLRNAHSSGKVRVTIGRASDYFGPNGDNTAITALAIGPGVAGKGIKWMGSLDKRHSVGYLPDIGRAYAILGESDSADGETWILPHGLAPTGGEFLAAVNRALPSPAKTGTITQMMLRVAAPFNKPSKESVELIYQWTDDFVADDSKFQQEFGPFETTPLDEAVKTTVDWYRRQAAAS
ncbi:MAG: NAD-dependent epimerase/dehydratase family protein [Pseudomonadota bacterium]|nr:NAD-dependent epimerase/dehydratase family protein [Pseudomonadota bacterium]